MNYLEQTLYLLCEKNNITNKKTHKEIILYNNYLVLAQLEEHWTVVVKNRYGYRIVAGSIRQTR